MTANIAMLTEARNQFHAALNSNLHLRDEGGKLTNADDDSALSRKLAGAIATQVGCGKCKTKPKGQTLGKLFEGHVRNFLRTTFLKLGDLRPGPWDIVEGKPEDAFARTEQYAHLKELAGFIKASVEIKAALGNDYVITPDVVILRHPWKDTDINARSVLVDMNAGIRSGVRADCGARDTMHASVSCKWTLRSDRAQNARSEGLNLIRNRKGQAPHIVAVTAEPLPSRIASIALGTGDIDCVYHFALPELLEAVIKHGNDDSSELLKTMVDGRRLKDIADLPLDLAT